MPTNSYQVRAMPQRTGAFSLGRHVEHDPRSLAYRLDTSALNIVTVDHTRRVPVFDQGNTGSCTGNACAGVLGSDPFYASLPTGSRVDEDLAVTIYSSATKLDTISGTYPPTDTGSTGLAAAKAAKAKGLISGYQHTFTTNDCLKALSATPVMIGINWYSSFDEPDADGEVTLARGASVEGGHEFVLHGIDVEQRLVHATNSWGTSWGNQGRFSFSFDVLDRLLSEDGDVTILVPLSKPAPVPAPTPAPAPAPAPKPDVPAPDADTTLAVAMKSWLAAKKL